MAKFLKENKMGFIIISLFFMNMALSNFLINNLFKSLNISNQNTILTNLDMENSLKSSANASWTILIYMDADNNLEGAGIGDINEAEVVGSSSSVNIVVQIDRIPGYDSSNGDWTGARRYFITKDYNQNTIGSSLIQDLGEVNMGSNSTLSSFIDWGRSNYPADRFALILWDHGSGPLYGDEIGGVCWDDSNDDDYLNLDELYNVLSTRHFDLLAFDACLMGSMEIFYQLKDCADVIIGSEKTEPGDGYPYDDILSWLILNPSSNAYQLGSVIVDKYYYSYPESEEITLSAVNSSSLLNLKDKISILSNYLINSSYNSEVINARDNAIHYDDTYFLDLYDFCLNLEDEISNSTIDSASINVRNAINSSIINEKHSSSLAGSHGISIYFVDSILYYTDNYELLRFCNNCTWDEMIKYITQPPNSDDQFEENDDILHAKLINRGFYRYLRIKNFDSDFFNISVNAGDFIEVYIYFKHTSELDLDLYLYNPNGTVANSSISVDDNESVSYMAPISGLYSIEVRPFKAPWYYETYDLEVILPLNDDSFEENDNFSTAANVTLYINSTINNLIYKDVDYYKFSAPCEYIINVTVKFNTYLYDLDVFLYDEDYNLIGYSITAGTEKILASVPYSVDGNEDIYLEIIGSEEVESYQIILNISNLDDNFEPNDNINQNAYIIPGNYLNLACYDKDFYRIFLYKDEMINITIIFNDNNGDLDLYFADSLLNLLNSSTSTTDNENIQFKVNSSGYFYILVDPFTINNKYDMIIQVKTNPPANNPNRWNITSIIITISMIGVGSTIGITLVIKIRKSRMDSIETSKFNDHFETDTTGTKFDNNETKKEDKSFFDSNTDDWFKDDDDFNI